MGTLRLGCALFLVVAAGCGSYVKHDDSGPPPLPKGSVTNGATAPRAGSDANSAPAAMMIATGSAGMEKAAAGMSAAGHDDTDDTDEAGHGGSPASAAVSGNAGQGGAGSGAGGASGASGRAGAGGRGGASGDDDQNPDDTTDRDVTGPCRDLDLFCLNNLDMFLLNPECFTCNDGMGCQSCEFFRAI